MQRRTYLQGVGAALGLGALQSVTGSEANRFAWRLAARPTDLSLYDVVVADGGPVAVGEEGLVIERRDASWTPRLQDGPAGNGNDLFAAAATEDRERYWVAGASGALAELHAEKATTTDRSAPNDATGNFHNVAVRGEAGTATVAVADHSGQVHLSTDNGRPGTWTTETPGSGSAIAGIADRDGTFVVADTNGDVFVRRSGWTKVGIEDAPSFVGLDADAGGTVVATADGVYTRTSGGWRRHGVGDGVLNAVERHPCGCVFAVGDGGTVRHRRMDGEWVVEDSPVGETLHAVTGRHPPLAVGDSGAILRHPDHKRG